MLPLVDLLRRMGYRVFFDVESLRVGDRWKVQLRESIRNSRALLLCWSAEAAASEFVRAEYSIAEASGKRVLPWLLDETPLPAMLEVQGIASRDSDTVARRLASTLRWTVTRRRLFTAALATLVGAGVLITVHMQQDTSFEFSGEVTDERNVPLEGVVVTAAGQSTSTDASGRFRLTIEGPRPEFIRVQFRCAGFREEGSNASTDGLFRFAMTREP